MRQRHPRAWLAAVLVFLALSGAAFAQVKIPKPVGPLHATPGPIPIMTAHPIVAPSATTTMRPPSLLIGKVPTGTKVPLSRLPRLPMRTALNTIHPGKHHGERVQMRPMAQTGATLTFTIPASCTTGGTIGDLFNVGCQLNAVAATGLTNWNGTDSYQYYVLAPNATTATEYGGAGAGCAPVTDPWTPAGIPSCTGTQTTLSVQGTYAFFAYDTTQKVIAAIVYVNAGQVFNIQVYQDPFHTQPSYQFDTQNSVAAYIYLQNVAPSDYYVTYVMSTGVNAYCAFMTPPGQAIPTPRPTGAGSGNPSPLYCDPSTSTGLQAPGGNLSVAWTFASTLEGGTYSIVVYDKTQNTTLGEVQVSLTAPGNAAILTQGSTTGMNPSPGPHGAVSSTVLAWDGTTDQSVGGVTGTTQQSIAAGTYKWTMINPEGRVLGGPTSVTLASKTTTANTYAFGATLQPPGEYPSAYWALGLFDTTNIVSAGSQSFSLVGYHATTRFIQSGVSELALNFPTAPSPATVTADLKISNDSGTVYNGQGDSFGQGNTAPGMIFTTDTNAMYSAARTQANLRTNGQGVIVTFSNGQNCDPSCSSVVADSSGNSWTVTDYCSETTPSSVAAVNDGCLLEFTPVNAGTVLAPGSYIDIPNMVWYAQGGNNGWSCYNTPCNELTSVLPTDGLSWSLANNAASPTAWTPITVGSVNTAHATLSGSGRFDYVGSEPTPPATACCVAQGASPVAAGAHFYEENFTRAEYQNSTPFSAQSRKNVAEFTIINKSTGTSPYYNITENGASQNLAIGFPSYIPASSVTTDAKSTATWGATVACPSSFGTQFVCWKGPTITGGCTSPWAACTANLWVDIPEPVTSFGLQELQIQGYAGQEFTWFTLSNDGASSETTTDGAYTFDSLGMAAYSLNSALMSAAFTPAVVGTGTNPTAFTVVINNTTTTADPFPDSIDAFVLEQTTSSTYTVNGSPTVTGAGANWAYQTTYTGSTANTLDYVFGVCGVPAKAVLAPQINSVSTPLANPYPGPTPCAAANELNSLQSGNNTATVNMKLNGVFAAGSLSFNLYAHGANGGGWSQPKPFTVSFTTESASAGFTTINGTSVGTNNQPTIGVAPPSTYVYTFSNTSASTSEKVFKITLPGQDVNGQNAWDGTASGYWLLVTPIASNITLGGTGLAGAGCSLNTNGANTFSPTTAGVNGQIEVDCTTGIASGKTLTVQFKSYNPSTQSDTYQFPSTVDGIATGQSWIGDQQVLVSFSVGLTVVVDPSNPGPGGSTPVVSCATCAFSGSTVDYGPIANSSSVTGSDIVRASVVYTGSTSAGNTWQLSASAAANPACVGASCGGILKELLVDVDSTNTPTNANGCGAMTITGAVSNTFVAVPITPTTQNLVSGPENQCTKPYDTIESYKVQIGTEAIIGQIVTVTYTLIVN
jgi:hypothetical protein